MPSTQRASRHQRGSIVLLGALVVLVLIAGTSCASSSSVAPPAAPSITTATGLTQRSSGPTAPIPTVTTTATTLTAADASATDAVIDLNAATVFGILPGDVEPELVIARLTPRLGAPTRDTGWYQTTSQPGVDGDCLGGHRQRVLRWGNLSFAFWGDTKDAGSSAVLWNWTLGDSAASGWGDRREPSPIPSGEPVAATTYTGFTIGASLNALEALFGDRLNFYRAGQIAPAGDAELALVTGASFHVLGFSLEAAQVTGIAASIPFC